MWGARLGGWLILIGGGIWLMAGNHVRAGYLYAPPNKGPIQESNSQQGGAFGNGNGTPDRYQQVYHAKMFTEDFAGPVYLLQVAFRPDGSVSNFPLSFSFADVEIGLSTTSKAPSGLSGNFAENLGTDYQVIHDGPVSFASATPGPVGGPHPFDFVINLATPFFYDPSQGNLLLDIKNLDDSGLVPILDAQQTNGNTTSSLSCLDNLDTGTASTLTLTTRFEVAKAPEPTSLLLLGTGLLGVAAYRWKGPRFPYRWAKG